MANETFREDDLVWLIEDSYMRGYYSLVRVTNAIHRSGLVIRSAIIQTVDGVYERFVVTLASVLTIGNYLSVTENRVGDAEAELLKYANQLKDKSSSEVNIA